MEPGATPTEERPSERRLSARERRWAVVRIVLGQAQILAATVGVVLLVLTGMSVPTIVAVGVAAALLLTSRLFFWRGRP
jgi:hypothetical protein